MLNTTTYELDLNSLKNKTVVSKLNDDATALLNSSNADNDINQTCDQSWALGTLKVMTISVPILCQKSSVGTDNGTF